MKTVLTILFKAVFLSVLLVLGCSSETEIPTCSQNDKLENVSRIPNDSINCNRKIDLVHDYYEPTDPNSYNIKVRHSIRKDKETSRVGITLVEQNGRMWYLSVSDDRRDWLITTCAGSNQPEEVVKLEKVKSKVYKSLSEYLENMYSEEKTRRESLKN